MIGKIKLLVQNPKVVRLLFTEVAGADPGELTASRHSPDTTEPVAMSLYNSVREGEPAAYAVALLRNLADVTLAAETVTEAYAIHKPDQSRIAWMETNMISILQDGGQDAHPVSEIHWGVIGLPEDELISDDKVGTAHTICLNTKGAPDNPAIGEFLSILRGEDIMPQTDLGKAVKAALEEGVSNNG